MLGVRGKAWLFWLFLGGVGANIAYLYPRGRWPIVIIGVVLLFVTLGVTGG
jgi:hypothetical protein